MVVELYMLISIYQTFELQRDRKRSVELGKKNKRPQEFFVPAYTTLYNEVQLYFPNYNACAEINYPKEEDQA